MSDTHDPSIKSERSRFVTLLAWAVAILIATFCLAWLFGSRFYLIDLLASQQFWISSGAMLLTLMLALIRRWRQALAALVLTLVSISPVLRSRVWSLPPVDPALRPERSVRLISCNLNPENPNWAQNIRVLTDYDPDFLLLLEAPYDLSRAIKYKNFLDETPYRYFARRVWVRGQTSFCILLSKYPLEVLEYGGAPDDAQHELHARVSLPVGDFVLGLMHPFSPRTRSRWREGNRVVLTQAIEAERLHESTGLPVIMGADLNATPAQSRARTMRNHGLRMCKPLLELDGSYPAKSRVPSWAAIQLDDVWVLGDARPIAWSMLDVSGSDHRAVIVDLRLDQSSP